MRGEIAFRFSSEPFQTGPGRPPEIGPGWKTSSGLPRFRVLKASGLPRFPAGSRNRKPISGASWGARQPGERQLGIPKFSCRISFSHRCVCLDWVCCTDMDPTDKMDPPPAASNNGRAPPAVPGVAGATAASAGADVSAPADPTGDNSIQRVQKRQRTGRSPHKDNGALEMPPLPSNIGPSGVGAATSNSAPTAAATTTAVVRPPTPAPASSGTSRPAPRPGAATGNTGSSNSQSTTQTLSTAPLSTVLKYCDGRTLAAHVSSYTADQLKPSICVNLHDVGSTGNPKQCFSVVDDEDGISPIKAI